MENENLNDYKLKINPEQVFNLTVEQEQMIKDALFHSINFLKRPAMIFGAGVSDEKNRLTDREREMCSYFSELLQDKIIFKWIDKPKNKDDVMDTMIEISVYVNHLNIEDLKNYIDFYKNIIGDESAGYTDIAKAWINEIEKWENNQYLLDELLWNELDPDDYWLLDKNKNNVGRRHMK